MARLIVTYTITENVSVDVKDILIMARLIVTYAITENISVDVKDFDLTEEELYKLGELKAKDFAPGIAEDIYWEWEQEPKAKDLQYLPPDDYWIESVIGQTAGSTILLVNKEFPIPKDYNPIRIWLDLKTKPLLYIDKLNALLSKDIKAMSPHCGWFGSSFAPFKEIDGLQILGDSKSSEAIGYMVLNDKLVGLIMPVSLPNKNKGDFQFE
jgi:hypothetical protein